MRKTIYMVYELFSINVNLVLLMFGLLKKPYLRCTLSASVGELVSSDHSFSFYLYSSRLTYLCGRISYLNKDINRHDPSQKK